MKKLFNGAFTGKKVLVTGHTGFKGSWLSLWLSELGSQVLGYALEPPTDPSLFELAALDGLVKDIRCDVRDGDALSRVITDHHPQVIFHMAAQPLVRRSYSEPVETFETNVMGTINVLQAARRSPSVKAIIIVTTDKCYENREWPWAYRENDPLGGHDPYSASKACAEIASAAWSKSFFGEGTKGKHPAALATVRAGNVIGGGDWAENRLIPDCVRALAEGIPISIRNPLSVRPWQHVLEPLSGYLHLAAALLEGNNRLPTAWNFGPAPGDHLTVGQVADKVVSLWGEGGWNKEESCGTLHEASWLKLDCTLAADLIGWRPVWGIEQALERTVSWYRSVEFSGGNPQVLCREDIALYIEDAARNGLSWSRGETG